jgi:tRNA/tmRNA/rRNA uracil-C5-methylase (TrmA/RlmC/RlmD family)
VIERQSETAQLVLVTREASAEPFAAFFAALGERLGKRLHSLWWNGQPERSNAVLGELWQRFAGPEAVSEVSAGTRLFYPPGAFGQSHLALAFQIAVAAAEFIPDGARVVEFYAGVGALGLPLAKRLQELTLNEVSPASLAGLELGIQALPSEVRARVRVVPGSAGDAAKRLTGAEVVLVDPPRKGLDPALLEKLVKTPAPRLVYVSCGLPALLREAARLLDSGVYRLTALRAFALFPYTEHVETLAVFSASDTPST